MVVQRSIEDLFTAHSMSNLQLGDDTASEMDPKLENTTSGGPGLSSDLQDPATQQPLSSTPNRPLQEPQNNLSVSATVSNEQIGSTIHTAHDSTMSVPGFESASNIFLGDASSSIPAGQSTGPNVSESVTDPNTEQDSSQQEDDAMDTTHQSAYTQHTEDTGSVVQPETSNLSSMDADQTAQLMAQQMPRGDVTPEGCRRTLTVAQLREHRPVESVPPTRPLHLPVVPAAPHVDKSAFPALPSSSRDGIGGIPGSKDYPQGTTEGFQVAFKKPDQDTIVPRVSSGRVSVPPSTTTTMTTSSPAVSQAVATTTTAATTTPSSSAVTGKKTLDLTVSVTRLSPSALESARNKLAAEADPNRSEQGKASSQASSTEEAMEFEVSHDSRQWSTSHVRTQHSCSHSTSRDRDRKSVAGKTSSASTPSTSKEPTRKSSHSGSTAASEALLKAGGVKPPGKDARPMPKYTHGKEYKVDYSREPCPPPAFQLDQPGGSYLKGSVEEPRTTWHADLNMSIATSQGHLQALAQAGSRHALYRSQQGMLQTRTEAIRVWDRANDAFQQVAREPVFVDEGHVGTVMASHLEVQRRNTALKADLKTARKSLETACQNTRDAQRTNEIQDKRVADLTSELKGAVAARDEARAEIEPLKAPNLQLWTTSGQEVAESAMVELNRQLNLTKQQLAERGSLESVLALTERCKKLKNSLQLSDQRLRETSDAGGLTLIQNRLDVAIEERDMALK